VAPGTGASEGTFCRSAYKAHTAHSPQRSVGESGAPQRWEKGLPQPIAVRAHRRIMFVVRQLVAQLPSR